MDGIYIKTGSSIALQWRHNGSDSVSNRQPYDCLLNGLFRRRSKKTSKLRVTGLCEGNLPGSGEFPAQMASYAENVSIWWRHHRLYADAQLWAWHTMPHYVYGNVRVHSNWQNRRWTDGFGSTHFRMILPWATSVTMRFSTTQLKHYARIFSEEMPAH